MKRRTLLRRTGALGALVLAGCTGDGNDGTGQHTPTRDDASDPGGSPTPTPTGPTVTGTSIRTVRTDCHSGDSETARVSVHTDERTVTVSGLLRTRDPCREAVLEAVHYDAGTETLRVDVSAERVGDGCVQCVGELEYEATVTFAGGVPGTVTVSHFGETVAGTGEGTPTETPAPGDTPTLADATLTVTNVTEGTNEETADVRFQTDADTVVLQGTLEGSDGCKTAALGTVEYDPEADALAVDVITRDREGTGERACTQALVYIEYEATVEFEGGLPTEVTVSHDGRELLSGRHATASAGNG